MANKQTCSHCGCINECVEVAINGETIEVCADCAKALGFVQCSDCGEWVKAPDALVTADGELICRDCYEAEFFTCEDCGRVHHIDDAVRVNPGQRCEKYVCESCSSSYYRCMDCGELFSYRYANQDRNGDVLCDDCYQSHDWYRCEDCGTFIREDDVVGYDGSNLCESCADRRTLRANFHDYGYKPTPEFHFRGREDESETLVFGGELEVDDGDDHLVLANQLAGIGMPIYMKHDGSLGEEGVEIVTHPCSLAYHTYELRWAEIARICRSNGYSSHDAGTCGLHIHVGREQMGESRDEQRKTAAKLVLLADAVWSRLVKFSRRDDSQINDWACRPDLDLDGDEDEDALICAARSTECDGRYQAVNLTNSKTVEFRIFRGSLKRDTIIAAFQLVSNMTKYAMAHTATECHEALWADVVGFEQFKELNNYCAKMGL